MRDNVGHLNGGRGLYVGVRYRRYKAGGRLNPAARYRQS